MRARRPGGAIRSRLRWGGSPRRRTPARSGDGGYFTYGATTLADGATFTVGSQQRQIDYNRTSSAGLSNFTADYLPSSSFVAITAVPEPSAIVLGLVGLVLGAGLVRGRRPRR